MPGNCDACARSVMEAIPAIMQHLRHEMRHHRDCRLPVPTFRVLAFLDRHPDASLSEVAEFIGMALPSMSKLVDSMVRRGFVARAESARDRRCVVLTITAVGSRILSNARKATQLRLRELLATLTEDERSNIVRALGSLRSIFDLRRQAEGRDSPETRPPSKRERNASRDNLRSLQGSQR